MPLLVSQTALLLQQPICYHFPCLALEELAPLVGTFSIVDIDNSNPLGCTYSGLIAIGISQT
jgi:hypothetical protein